MVFEKASGRLAVSLAICVATTAQAGDYPPLRTETDAGNVALCVTADGIVGNGFSFRNEPSCNYPRGSANEHLYLGGVWVGAVLPTGERRVSTAAQDANGLQVAEAINEFTIDDRDPGNVPFRVMTNNQNESNYHPNALAPFHLESRFYDGMLPATGDHRPLGITVTLRALAWNQGLYDDFVILSYTVTNMSGVPLADVYVGFYNDTTVGNTDYTNPWNPWTPPFWNYYDDLNGAWRPGDYAGDPTLWMMHEHDADGDAGMATTWVGCRLLGTVPDVAAPYGRPPVSYNCWSFHGVPDDDDSYPDPDGGGALLPGKYQLMANGDFDVGVTPDGDFTVPGNRQGLLATGPFPSLAAGASVTVTFALVLGEDADHLRTNSRLAKLIHDYGYEPTVARADEPSTRVPVLGPAVPNPFNPRTTVTYAIPRAGPVRVTVHDLQGRQVAVLAAGHAEAGAHEVSWDGRDSDGAAAAAGTYLVRLEGPGGLAATKVVLQK